MSFFHNLYVSSQFFHRTQFYLFIIITFISSQALKETILLLTIMSFVHFSETIDKLMSHLTRIFFLSFNHVIIFWSTLEVPGIILGAGDGAHLYTKDVLPLMSLQTVEEKAISGHCGNFQDRGKGRYLSNTQKGFPDPAKWGLRSIPE